MFPSPSTPTATSSVEDVLAGPPSLPPHKSTFILHSTKSKRFNLINSSLSRAEPAFRTRVSVVSLFHRDVTSTGVTLMRSFQQHNRTTG